MPERNDYRSRPQQQRLFTPEIQYPTPNIDDVIIVEDVALDPDGYRPLPYGTPRYGDATALLVWQGPFKAANNEVFHRRVYATNRNAEDAYNAAIEYVGDSASHPTYIRNYLIPRKTYSRAAAGAALTSLTAVNLTAGGTGYTEAPVITFTGGAGSGAAATAEVQDGVVVAIVVTNTGTGYTSAPTVVFTPVVTGTGAAATAVIQSTSAVLVKETSQPAPGELGSTHLAVTRVYVTLPGPILYEDVYDVRRGAVQRARQQVAAASVDGTLTNAAGVITETSYNPVNTVISEKIIETWTLGSAPTLTEDVYDTQRGAVQRTRQYVASAAVDGTLTNAAGTITETNYSPVNAEVSDKVIETWVLANAPTLTEDVYDIRRGAVQRTKQYIAAAAVDGTLANNAGTITETTYNPVNTAVSEKTIETWVLANAPAFTEDVYDIQRGAVQRVSQYIAAASVDGTLVNSSGTITETTYKPVDTLVLDKVIETWVLANAPTLTEEAWEPRKGRITRAVKYVASGTAASYTIATNTLTEVTQKPVNSVIAQQTTETWDVSASPTVMQDIYDPRKGAVQVASLFIKADGTEVGTVSHSGGTITEISYKPVDHLVLDKVTETWVISSAPALIKYDVDDEAVVNSTGRKAGVTITEQLILKPANFAALGNTEGTQVTYYPINDVYGNKISLALLAYADIGTRTEYKFGPYRYPPLVLDVTASGAEAKDGTVRTQLNWERRAGRNRNVQYKIEVTYGTQSVQEAARAALTIFDPALNDLIYDGIFFNVSHQGVLNDLCEFSYTTGTTNQKWPYIVESVSFAASDLTATEWLALESANGNAGTEKVVNAVLSPWKYNLWRLEVFKVTIKA